MVCFFRDPMEGMALVQEVDFQTGQESARESQLFGLWTLRSKENRTNGTRDAIFEVMDVESLSDRIYVVDPAPVGSFCCKDANHFALLVVKYVKEEWPASFLKSPHYLMAYQYD